MLIGSNIRMTTATGFPLNTAMVLSGQVPLIFVGLQSNIEMNDTPSPEIQHHPSKQLRLICRDGHSNIEIVRIFRTFTVPATCVRICICSCRCCRGSRYSLALPPFTSSNLESICTNLSLYNLKMHGSEHFLF